MKRLSTLALVVGLALGGPALAMGPHGAHGPEAAARHLERMTSDLDLDEAQVARLRTIMEAQHAKMRALHDETHAQITEVLTPAQRARFEEIAAERQARWAERRNRRQERHGDDAP